VGAQVNAAGWTASKIKAVAQAPLEHLKGTWVGQKAVVGVDKIKAVAVNNPRTTGTLGSAGVIGLSNQGQNPAPLSKSGDSDSDGDSDELIIG
jgi:hypothetical protein